MTAAAPAGLLREESSASSAQRLATLARQREGMAGPHGEAWRSVRALAAPMEQEAWAQAVLELAHVNVGPAALIAFWRITIADIARLGVPSLATMARGLKHERFKSMPARSVAISSGPKSCRMHTAPSR